MGEEVKRVVHAESKLVKSQILQIPPSESIKTILKPPDMFTYIALLLPLTGMVGVPLILTLVQATRPTYKITKAEEGYYMMKVDRDVIVQPAYIMEKDQKLIKRLDEMLINIEKALYYSEEQLFNKFFDDFYKAFTSKEESRGIIEKMIEEFEVKGKKELADDIMRYLYCPVYSIVRKTIIKALSESDNVVFYEPIGPCGETRYIIIWNSIMREMNVTVNLRSDAYEIPGTKLGVLKMLKDAMPGLIDFSTEPSMFTRLARLMLKLDGDDFVTLAELFAKAYNINAVPKDKWDFMAFISDLARENSNVFTLIDFEGETHITIRYIPPRTNTPSSPPS
jgi:hypothetical protein